MSRRMLRAGALCAGALCAGSAGAQVSVPVRYELNPPRCTLLAEECLPPCLCPYLGWEAPMDGTYLLSRVGQDPLFTHYRVSDIEWIAAAPVGPARVTGSGRYRLGGGTIIRQHEMILDLEVNGRAWHVESGLVPVGLSQFPDIVIEVPAEQVGCSKITVRLNSSVDEFNCYADCDWSTGRGTLDIFDFLCFQNAFAAGRPYACDCDETPPQTCDIFDFLCFQNQYAEGCRP